MGARVRRRISAGIREEHRRHIKEQIPSGMENDFVTKIDNSTYKALKRERGWNNSLLSHIGEPEKGT